MQGISPIFCFIIPGMAPQGWFCPQPAAACPGIARVESSRAAKITVLELLLIVASFYNADSFTPRFSLGVE